MRFLVLAWISFTVCAQELPIVTNVEQQPLAAQVMRVIEALELVGEPLPAGEAAELKRLAALTSGSPQAEIQKILGRVGNGAIDPHPVVVSASTTRVPVHDGHTVSTAVKLEQQVTPEALVDAFNGFRGRPQELNLPSAPPQPLVYLTERNRPQPALDVNRDGGMTVSVGRLRRCPVLDYKFIALGHNTIRGAAGAAILNAELMREEGML